jgi:hypothetical protein
VEYMRGGSRLTGSAIGGLPTRCTLGKFGVGAVACCLLMEDGGKEEEYMFGGVWLQAYMVFTGEYSVYK